MRFRFLVATLAWLSAPVLSAANVIISDLPLTNAFASTGFGTNLGEVIYKAQAFTMGSTSYNLTAASFVFGFNTAASGRVVSVDLYSNNAGVPGSLIANVGTLAYDGTTVGYVTYDFSPVGITLQANTTYWLRASANTYWEHQDWYSGNPQSVPSGAGATYYASSTWDGSNWTTSTFYNSYELRGDPLNGSVPEPGAWLLVTAGAVGMVLFRKKTI